MFRYNKGAEVDLCALAIITDIPYLVLLLLLRHARADERVE